MAESWKIIESYGNLSFDSGNSPLWLCLNSTNPPMSIQEIYLEESAAFLISSSVQLCWPRRRRKIWFGIPEPVQQFEISTVGRKNMFLSYSGWCFLNFMAKTTNRCDHTSGLDQPRPRSSSIKSDRKGTSTTLWNWWLMTLRRHSRKLAMLTIHNVRNILGSSSVCYSVCEFCLNNMTT